MNELIKNQAKKIGQIIFVLVISITGLSSCVTALVAGAAIATIDIIHDRRSAGEYVDDNTIELSARNYLVSSKSLRATTHINPVSWNGILLTTGEIDSEQTRSEVMRYMQAIDGVRQLVDETTITGKNSIVGPH